MFPAHRARRPLAIVAASAAILSAAAPAGAQRNCHPSYLGACIPPNASDVDCFGGTGNGPLYIGRVRVVGPDVYRLDADGYGIGCEDFPAVRPGGSILAE